MNYIKFIVAKFKVFIGVLICVAIKEVPHMKLHWSKSSHFFLNSFHYKLYIIKRRLGNILKCIHLVANNSIFIDKTDLAYDKFAKIKWLIETCNFGMWNKIYLWIKWWSSTLGNNFPYDNTSKLRFANMEWRFGVWLMPNLSMCKK